MLEVFLFFDKTERSAATGYVFYEGKMLLIKQTYGPKNWTYPGGFLHQGEKAEIGLRREVYEEVGLVLTRVKLIEKAKDTRQKRNIIVYRFYGEAKTNEVVPDKVEVSEAQWVAQEEVRRHVPSDTYLDKAIELHKKYAHYA